MLPAPLKNPLGVRIIITASGSVPPTAVIIGGFAVEPTNPPSLYVVFV